MLAQMQPRAALTPRLPAEPDSHVIARHLQTGLRTLLVVFVLGTIGALLFYRDVSYLLAIPIPLLYCALIVANAYERGSQASVLREQGETTPSDEEVALDEEVVGVATVLKVAGVLAIAAIVIAASFFEWQMVGVIAACTFLYLAFMGLPFWPLIIREAEREEHEKVTGETE